MSGSQLTRLDHTIRFEFQNLANDYLGINLGVNLEFILPNIYSRTFRLFGLSCEIIVFWLSAERIRANYNLLTCGLAEI